MPMQSTRQPTSRIPADRLSATLALDQPVTSVPGVSTARASLLAKLGVHTVRDLLMHFPRRYMDLTRVTTAAEAKIGESCTVFGTIYEVKLKRPRPNLPITEITITDETGMLLISMFHQPWLANKLRKGQMLMVAGRVEFNYGFKRMTNPFLEVAEDARAEGRVIPVHPATEKLTPAQIRKIEQSALDVTSGVYDPIPLAMRINRDLMARGAALRAIHFPDSMDEVEAARDRLVYEEVLFLQLLMMRESQARVGQADPVCHVTDGPLVNAFATSLSYALTDEQEAARAALFEVMAKPRVANHMLLGDVGTGKTVVAAFGIAAAVDTGKQAALLVPTEVLAQQHAQKLGSAFDVIGITWGLLTGSTPKDERARMLEGFRSGEVSVLIGTHALLQNDVVAHDLSFVVIDEQQRFGVSQRAAMLAKGDAPDALYLTATPIPRSLALALFGNLTLSYIHERPHTGAGRKTRVLSSAQRGRAYDGALAALIRGEQVYVVCPLIGVSADERDKAAGKNRTDEGDEPYHPKVSIEDEGDFEHENLAAAEQEAEFLQNKVFVDYRVGLLHGAMTPEDKEAVMDAFKAGDVHVLVTTTVIEVGVDVPNATIMIVEDADRFGLSQLHQLRGRVGRGEASSEVFFVSASKQDAALKRLAVLEQSDDGFEIAQYDLALRREGDILGNRQSGTSMLKLVNIIRDSSLIEAAHEDASAIMEADPGLADPDHRALAREMRILFKDAQHATAGG